MKPTLIFISIILFTFTSLSQTRITVTKWEANTKNGGYYIGIAQSRMNALLDIERLSKITEGSELEIVDFDIRLSSIMSNKDEKVNVFEKFASTNKDGELYKFLSLNDMTALKVTRERGKEKGISFYQNVNSIKSNKKASLKFCKEVYAFRKFLFIKERKYNETYITYLQNK